LLTGFPRKGPLNVIKSERLASNMAIYRVLAKALQPDNPKKRKLSEIFMCQLAELVSAEPRVKSLGDGQALWRAVDRSNPKS
jgi:hypothetical protein